ncbi:MAG TPA: hypothetical protein VFS75_03165 [Candidatus Paceibacterota bacterium]|nr:hypothetical protein [Candidatus Paceibacterota bacterium]
MAKSKSTLDTDGRRRYVIAKTLAGDYVENNIDLARAVEKAVGKVLCGDAGMRAVMGPRRGYLKRELTRKVSESLKRTKRKDKLAVMFGEDQAAAMRRDAKKREEDEAKRH